MIYVYSGHTPMASYNADGNQVETSMTTSISMNEKMGLRRWMTDECLRLAAFEAWYHKQHDQDPECFPLELDASMWDEAFMTFDPADSEDVAPTKAHSPKEELEKLAAWELVTTNRQQAHLACLRGIIALHPDDALHVGGTSRNELDNLRAAAGGGTPVSVVTAVRELLALVQNKGQPMSHPDNVKLREAGDTILVNEGQLWQLQLALSEVNKSGVGNG